MDLKMPVRKFQSEFRVKVGNFDYLEDRRKRTLKISIELSAHPFNEVKIGRWLTPIFDRVLNTQDEKIKDNSSERF